MLWNEELCFPTMRLKNQSCDLFIIIKKFYVYILTNPCTIINYPNFLYNYENEEVLERKDYSFKVSWTWMIMRGRCEECGMENVEVMSITKDNKDEKITLCNQCRPADGAYAY